MKKWIFKLLIVSTFIPFHSINGQNQEVISVSLQDSLSFLKDELLYLKMQNERIESRLDSLILNLTRKEEEEKTENDLQKLLEDAEQLSSKKVEEEIDISKKFHSGERQQQGLNPNFSVLGDYFFAISSENNELDQELSDFSHGYNGIYMRSLELSMVASLDPFARGKAFLDINQDEISVEEAYMELINLPLKMSLKAGIFFPEFGLLNRYHTHALSQFNRPQVCVNYFGLDGFNGTGIALNFLLPELLFSEASTFDLSVLHGNYNNSFMSENPRDLIYVGHLKNFYELSEASYIEYTISGIGGKNNDLTNDLSWIGSFGIHYKWQPPAKAKYKSSDWRAEIYYGSRQTPSGTEKSKGFYLLCHNKISARFWFGARIGYSELPYDASQYIWDYTVNVDFWQSEFVFYRLQYQYNKRNVFNIIDEPVIFPSDHAFLLQISWAMGPHKHEAY